MASKSEAPSWRRPLGLLFLLEQEDGAKFTVALQMEPTGEEELPGAHSSPLVINY